MRVAMTTKRPFELLLLVVGFVAGMVVAMTALTFVRDDQHERSQVDDADETTQYFHPYHDHRHHRDVGGNRNAGETKAVNLSQKNKHQHAGIGGTGCTYVWKAMAHRHVSGSVQHPATSEAQCQAACINDTSCIGVDFNSAHQCFLILAGAPGQGNPVVTGEDDAANPTVEEERSEMVYVLAASDDTVAESLRQNIRVLCWVMTMPQNHMSKAVHVQATWGRRCNVLLFVSEGEAGALTVVKVDVGTGREHLTAKTMSAFDHIYERHRDEADWFLKADDDTYVIVENLRYFLSSHDPSEPVFFGHHFKGGFFSGGAGYVLSKEALRRFGNRTNGTCQSDHGGEDVEMGHCMERLGVKAGDSRDALGRSRFHCLDPGTHIHGRYPDWYLQLDTYGAKQGIESISDYAISFHYVTAEQLYDLDFYVYHLRPYGIISGQQELNRKQ